jgi:hypothetical protein
LQRIDYEDVMRSKARYSVKTWQKALQSASYQPAFCFILHADMMQMSV